MTATKPSADPAKPATSAAPPVAGAAPDGAGSALTPTAHLRIRRTRVFGLALFLVTEIMIFVPMFAVRFLTAGTGQPDGLNTGVAVVLTLVMVLSFAAMHLARVAARRSSWTMSASALWVAALLAIVTAAGSAIGWSDPALAAATNFGGIFYLTTGAHAVHLVLGAGFAGGLAVQARRGRFATTTLLDCAYWFWAFLLVVWLAIDVVFYLV